MAKASNFVFNCGTTVSMNLSVRLCLSQDDFDKLTRFTKSYTHSTHCFGALKWDPMSGKCLSFEVGPVKRFVENENWPFQMNTRSILQLEGSHLAKDVAYPCETLFMTGDLFPAPIDSVQDTETYEKVFFSIGTLIGFCLKHSIPVELPLHPLFIDLIQHGCSDLTNLDDGLIVSDSSAIAKNRIDRFGRSGLQSLFSFLSHVQDVDSFALDSALPGYPFVSVLDAPEVTSDSYCDWLLKVADQLVGSGIRKAVDLVRGGIAWMMDAHCLAMFTTREISEMLVGNAPLWTKETIDSLFVFNATESALESAEWLKEVVLEMSNAQKEQFLMFVTGQRRMNADSNVIQVEFVDCDESSLPTSMTCVNLLRLPRYVDSLFAFHL